MVKLALHFIMEELGLRFLKGVDTMVSSMLSVADARSFSAFLKGIKYLNQRLHE